jgi:hypothetical protein
MGLEISRDEKLERNTWIFERIGWGFMAAVIVAALLGLFGTGLPGPTEIHAENGALSVELSRFIRARAPTSLEIRFDVPDGATEAEIWMSAGYLMAFSSEMVRPEPEAVALAPDRWHYTFRLAGTEGEATVTFHLEPQEIGRISGEIGLTGGPALAFWQFIHP